MNQKIKHKVLDWMSEKIKHGELSFDVTDCVQEIGLNPFNKVDVDRVEEVFEWHEFMMNSLYIEGFDENT